MKPHLLTTFLIGLGGICRADPVILSPFTKPLAVADYSRLEQHAVQGQLVYAYDNATYGAGGLQWPWDNVIVFRDAHSKPTRVKAQSVFRKKYDFVFNPRWMSDGSLLFGIGDVISSYGTYQLVHLNPRTNSVEVLKPELSWKQFFPSPSARYVAYVEGAQAVPIDGPTPASLHVYDFQTHTDRKIGDKEPLLGSIAWTPDDKLLFSFVPERSPTPPTLAPTLRSRGNIRQLHPAILQENQETGEVSPFIPDAFLPSVSPDGQWITYLSVVGPLPPPKDVGLSKVVPNSTLSQQQDTLYLMLAKRDGSKKWLLRANAQNYAATVWFPDSSGLIVCNRSLAGRQADNSIIEVSISRCRLNTPEAEPKLERIGSLHYVAPDGTELSADDLLLRPICVTRDGHSLILELVQQVGAPEPGLTLKAFDLQSGQEETLARIGSVRHLDWRELPPESTK